MTVQATLPCSLSSLLSSLPQAISCNSTSSGNILNLSSTCDEAPYNTWNVDEEGFIAFRSLSPRSLTGKNVILLSDTYIGKVSDNMTFLSSPHLGNLMKSVHEIMHCDFLLYKSSLSSGRSKDTELTVASPRCSCKTRHFSSSNWYRNTEICTVIPSLFKSSLSGERRKTLSFETFLVGSRETRWIYRGKGMKAKRVEMKNV